MKEEEGVIFWMSLNTEKNIVRCHALGMHSHCNHELLAIAVSWRGLTQDWSCQQTGIDVPWVSITHEILPLTDELIAVIDF